MLNKQHFEKKTPIYQSLFSRQHFKTFVTDGELKGMKLHDIFRCTRRKIFNPVISIYDFIKNGP